MIDATTTGKVLEILDAGRLANRTDADDAARISTGDQILAGLRDACERLGLPMDAQTGTAYALGVLHTLEELDPHLGESRCLAAHLLVLYSRAALIADQSGAGR
jgi:hypothetical protein